LDELNTDTIPQPTDHRDGRDRATLRDEIARQRDLVIDLDVVVDIRREGVDLAVDDLREAVRQRDTAAVHLDRLLAWHDELAA
jgi:hypothetical protein